MADNGHEVRLWGHNEKQVNEINENHTNEKYLPEIDLPDKIKGYASLEEALEGVETIIIGCSNKGIREVIGKIGTNCYQPFTIVHVSKGIEPDSLMRISEMIKEEMLRLTLLKDIVVLIWPKSCRGSKSTAPNDGNCFFKKYASCGKNAGFIY